MNTDKITKEFARCKELLRVEEPDSEMTEEKKWWMIGVSYIMARFTELSNEMTEEDVDDFYENILIEAQYEIMTLDEIDEDDNF
jgi:hypothetical protein